MLATPLIDCIEEVKTLPPEQLKDYSPNQSKLNCEVLSPELGLQLRWSLAGSSIILQIVANLGELLLWNGILFSGSEMYMAIGVKAGKVR